MQPIACTIAVLGRAMTAPIALVQIVVKESEKILPEGTKSSINSRLPAAPPAATWIQHRRRDTASAR
jgi:hypothetical protein